MVEWKFQHSPEETVTCYRYITAMEENIKLSLRNALSILVFFLLEKFRCDAFGIIICLLLSKERFNKARRLWPLSLIIFFSH